MKRLAVLCLVLAGGCAEDNGGVRLTRAQQCAAECAKSGAPFWQYDNTGVCTCGNMERPRR